MIAPLLKFKFKAIICTIVAFLSFLWGFYHFWEKLDLQKKKKKNDNEIIIF